MSLTTFPVNHPLPLNGSDTERDAFWMRHALTLAEKAARMNEVPVGAIVVLGDEIIGEGFNSPICQNDPTAHAEMIAIRKAAEKISNYRLPDAELYVTLEPCNMCAGAMVHARIKRLVYGATESKAGAIVSKLALLDQAFLNHKVQHTGGILAKECSTLLSNFFRDKRLSET